MIPYDTNFDPAAITLEVAVTSVVHRRPQVDLSALIDTGADISAIPEPIIKQLNLYPVGRLQLEDANAVKTSVYTYEANMSVNGQAAEKIEIIATPFPFVILGRDWLNNYYLYLDGPGQNFLLSHDALKVEAS